MKKIASTKQLVVTTTTVRDLTPEALSQVVGGQPVTTFLPTPTAPDNRRTRVGR